VNRSALVATVAVLAAATGCDATAPTSETIASNGTLEANATIDYVVDGDTVDVLIDGREERIRLIGIDTPETKRPDTDIECYGPEATAFTESLLPVGTPVRIERDTVNRDDYGRLLGYLYRADDGIFINYELVRQGFAQPLSIEPNTTYRDLFVDAASAAEQANAGLWSECGD
jgi:micrococcal nuclease